MAIVTTDDKHYKAIADTIREFVVPPNADEIDIEMHYRYSSEEMPDGIRAAVSKADADGYLRGYNEGLAESGGGGSYDQGYTDGQQAEYDRFWDAYQANGNLTSGNGLFAGPGWDNDTLKPKYGMSPTSANHMFAYCNYDGDLDDVFQNRGLTLDLSGCNSFNQTFYQARIAKLGTIDLSKVTITNNVLNVFNSEYLTTIRCFIPPQVAMATACFQSNLETFIIGGEIRYSMNLSRCSKLTTKSVKSIIDHLADLTGATAQTLTFHATVGGKLTQEQKDAASAKNWTLAY